jgi:hypothetical protein
VAHGHLALERADDLGPIFAKREADGEGGAGQDEGEKGNANEVAHSLSPCLSTTQRFCFGLVS